MTIGSHSETLTFDVALLGGHNIILGLPWLQQHDPLIHWSAGKITFTSDYCETNCLAQPASTFLNQRPLVRSPTTPEKSDDVELDPLTTEEIELFAIDLPGDPADLPEDLVEIYGDHINTISGKNITSTLSKIQGDPEDFPIDLDPVKSFLKPSQPYHMNQEECIKCWKVLDEMLNGLGGTC